MLSYERRHGFNGAAKNSGGGVVGAVFTILTTIGTQSVVNTAAETSLIPGPVGLAPGSSQLIQGGRSRAGDLYHIRLEGGFSTNGAGQTGQIRGKLNSTTVVDSGVFTFPNTGLGLFSIDYDMLIINPGNPGAINIVNFIVSLTTSTGLQTPALIYAFGLPAINFSIDETIDVTQTWGAASASNAMNMNVGRIALYRP